MGKWINIFKTGTHTDSSGKTRSWTRKDLAFIVANYQQRTEDAPVVFGHPKSTEPAQGWIKATRLNGEKLQAQLTQISDKAQKALDNGGYKYGSLSLSPDLKIRHFGLLGAVPPAVKGLGRVEFGAGENGHSLTVDINFNVPDDIPAPEENDMSKELEAKVAALEKQQAEDHAAREKAEADLKAKEDEYAQVQTKHRKKALVAGVDKLIAGGKLLPANKDKMLAFCKAMDGTNTEMSFSEDEGKKPLLDHFMSFMAENTSHDLLTEFSAPNSGNDDDSNLGDLATKF